jgi:hypothetical protein
MLKRRKTENHPKPGTASSPDSPAKRNASTPPTALSSGKPQPGSPKFREIGTQLKKMDRLVLRFRRTESGTAFTNAWQASRIIRDLGGSAPAEPAPAAVA